MSEMIERVARAISDELERHDAAHPGQRFGPAVLDAARASIEAMRELDLADAIQHILAQYVLETGEFTVSRDEAVNIWHAMIDAAATPSSS